MSGLSVSLLGPVEIIRDGKLVSGPAHDKVRALLAYLAVESDRPHRRELLAELLWPDQPEGRGRHSLRQALVTLRQMIGDQDQEAPLLLATRDNVRLHPDAGIDLDIVDFNARLQAYVACDCNHDPSCPNCISNLEAAIERYRGDFLAGFTIDASSEFDNWVSELREHLRLRVLSAAHALCEVRLHSGEYLRAIDVARYQLALDASREEAHRQLMLALYLSGDRRAALAQFDQCMTVLDRELGLEPDAETVALRDAIRDQTIPLRTARGLRVRLPMQATPFIGREMELADIAATLHGTECRLLTLSGAGGAGKTRLAIEAASRAGEAFRDGVVFVPLAGAFTHDALVSALTDALFPGGVDRSDPEDALMRFVQDREMLIVLDNFEQLVKSARLVADLLASGPALHVLVTSRERLNLYEEWVIDLDGLLLPDALHPEQLLQSDAVQLFIASARRTNSRFTVEGDDIIQIGRICRLVNGMPLALELAAAWSPVLSLAEIAAEIEKSLDFLASSFRDVPDRHRSMRAVFDRSWLLLSGQEREVFARLSILRGSFGRKSVEQIAGASLGILSALVSKSLVIRRDAGRYEVHELLRQYGEAKLLGMGTAHRETAERHAEYFCMLISEHERSLRGHDQEASLRDLTAEIENLRVAWRWAIEHDRADLLLEAAHGLWIFLEVTSRYIDADILFGHAAERLRGTIAQSEDSPAKHLTFASMLVRHGAVFVRLGDNHRGEALVEEGCELAREVHASGTLGLGLNFKGMFALERLDYREAAGCLLESIECFRAAGDLWGEAYSTSDLSMAAFRLGDLEEVEHLHEKAVRMFTEIGDKRGLAFALYNRGFIAEQTGDFAEARRMLLNALDIWRTINHAWAISATLTQLGVVTGSMGDLNGSRQYLLEALRVAHEVQSMPAVLAALNEIAANIAQDGSIEAARQLLLAVVNHPASYSAAGKRAGELLAGLGPGEDPSVTGAQDGDPFEIEKFSRELLENSASAPGLSSAVAC